MSMIQSLGKIPLQFVASQTAEELALVAYSKALKICKPGKFDFLIYSD
ncbi:DNA double-strand break repair protein Mre11 [Bienertia sinuspersici]